MGNPHGSLSEGRVERRRGRGEKGSQPTKGEKRLGLSAVGRE